MTKRWMYVALSLLLGAIALVNCGSTKQSAQRETLRFEGDALALYGEAVFEESSCMNCHSRQIANLDVQLVSLDGVGGKYPNSWLYYYLFDPNGIKAHAEMPSYAELYTAPLDEAVLQRKLQEGGWQTAQEGLWGALQAEAASMAREVQGQGETVKPAEILALMAYVQAIPASKTKLLLDSFERARELQQQEVWENIGLDSNSVILKVAQQQESIARGYQLFKGRCAVCHGLYGEGGVGPNLTDEYWLHGGQLVDITTTIIYGIPEKGMISWRYQLTPVEVGELVAYVSSIRGSKPADAKGPQGQKQ